jgi:hypothetical protein
MLASVRVRDCACPGTPHEEEGDLVFLHPTLPVDGGIIAEQQLLSPAVQLLDDATERTNLLTRLWLRTFVTHGTAGWNLLDEAGEPVPFDLSVILADWSLARPVGDRASDLYADSVLHPFLNRPDRPSPTGRTQATTSRRPRPIQEPSA